MDSSWKGCVEHIATSNICVNGYNQGKEYGLNIHRMLCGRFQVFKSIRHFREPSGHKAYDTIEDVFEDFTFSDKEKASILAGIDSVKAMSKAKRRERLDTTINAIGG